MRKIKQATASLALMLGIGAFLLPTAAYAQGAEDATPPTVSASLSGGTIHIEASDEGSGIDAVFIGGRRAEFTGSALDVPFSEYAEDGQGTLEIYAKDLAGNQSETVEVTKTANPLTPDGQATVTDNATDEDGKEFYTFTTPEGNVFYLVIDRERDSENVYFLNAVTEADLAALAEKATEEGGSWGMAAAEETCACPDKCVAGAVNMACPVCINDLTACTGQEPEEPVPETEAAAEPSAESAKQDGANSGAAILAVIAALIAGGAGYYFKIYRPKHELDDAEDLDDLLDDAPEINEDGPDGEEMQPESLQEGWNGPGAQARRTWQETAVAGAEEEPESGYMGAGKKAGDMELPEEETEPGRKAARPAMTTTLTTITRTEGAVKDEAFHGIPL